MKVKLVGSQYKVLSKYFEDLSKASVISTFGGYFLPSVLRRQMTDYGDIVTQINIVILIFGIIIASFVLLAERK